MNLDQPKKFLNNKQRDKKMLWNDIMENLSKLKNTNKISQPKLICHKIYLVKCCTSLRAKIKTQTSTDCEQHYKWSTYYSSFVTHASYEMAEVSIQTAISMLFNCLLYISVVSCRQLLVRYAEKLCFPLPVFLYWMVWPAEWWGENISDFYVYVTHPSQFFFKSQIIRGDLPKHQHTLKVGTELVP